MNFLQKGELNPTAQKFPSEVESSDPCLYSLTEQSRVLLLDQCLAKEEVQNISIGYVFMTKEENEVIFSSQRDEMIKLNRMFGQFKMFTVPLLIF